MPSWWGKSSSKDEKKKANKESLIDTLHRKFRIATEERSRGRCRGLRRRFDAIVSERGAISRAPSRSPSPSTKEVSRCQSFAERSHALPLPLPTAPLITIRTSKKPGLDKGTKSVFLPLPKPQNGTNTGVEGDLATASVSSGSSAGDNPSESQLNALVSDCENGLKTTLGNSSRDLSAHGHKHSAELLKPVSSVANKTHNLPTSVKRRPLGSHVQNLQIPQRDILCSAPDSLLSSPCRSPLRSFVPDQVSNHGLVLTKPYSDVSLLGSGQCSSPGSGYNSGNNSIGGDMSGQLLWPQSRCSPECSPAPSPRLTSPGPGSRIQSGAVTPLHPRAGGSTTGSPSRRFDDSKPQSHRLPLPPLTISNTCSFSPTYSAATSPSVPPSPARAEATVSPASRWKKGRLLGRGSFGHVYLGFNSESGEMCAMKEVTLFPDDPKSKECAQQLGQEVMLLSRLHHPNIVQYYGSETVDDKLYIYLEFVSGGSIHKLLQEYGEFGENAIRNYTHQILSGLSYLHAKRTVHRDIKGANILVDPYGRVKLADFGMAKHITAQSGPLSFKGSPYWMAPEVIKNSSGSNLAVDIWSLGCTVLEMATAKPPWGQYEWVPAMFKIGNSKELPEIPNNLSEEGKDFVRLCLQRNPEKRPSASQLLEHPFVRTPDPASDTLLVRSLDTGTSGRSLLSIDVEDAANLQPRGLKPAPGFSIPQSRRNMSCPISPVGSPILNAPSLHQHQHHHHHHYQHHQQHHQQMSGRKSPSPISSPHCQSGSSTPRTGGGAIPYHHHHHHHHHHHRHTSTTFLQDHSSRGNNGNNNNNNTIFKEARQDMMSRGGTRTPPPPPPHMFWADNHNNNGASSAGQALQLDQHVSQQLLNHHLHLTSLDFRSSALSSTPAPPPR